MIRIFLLFFTASPGIKLLIELQPYADTICKVHRYRKRLASSCDCVKVAVHEPQPYNGGELIKGATQVALDMVTLACG